MNDRPLPLVERVVLGAAGLAAFIGLWTLLSTTGIVPR